RSRGGLHGSRPPVTRSRPHEALAQVQPEGTFVSAIDRQRNVPGADVAEPLHAPPEQLPAEPSALEVGTNADRPDLGVRADDALHALRGRRAEADQLTARQILEQQRIGVLEAWLPGP